jgi:hypothetical protein
LAAIDLRQLQPVLPDGDARHLPVAEMTGEEDQRPATGHRSIDMLHPDHLDTGARREASQPRQMRILGGDAAEIVPHLPDDAPALRVGEVRQGEIEIAQRPARHREARPNEAGDGAARGRGDVERQDTHGREERRHAACLEQGKRMAKRCQQRAFHRAHAFYQPMSSPRACLDGLPRPSLIGLSTRDHGEEFHASPAWRGARPACPGGLHERRDAARPTSPTTIVPLPPTSPAARRAAAPRRRSPRRPRRRARNRWRRCRSCAR